MSATKEKPDEKSLDKAAYLLLASSNAALEQSPWRDL
jgi:hypothetical protein